MRAGRDACVFGSIAHASVLLTCLRAEPKRRGGVALPNLRLAVARLAFPVRACLAVQNHDAANLPGFCYPRGLDGGNEVGCFHGVSNSFRSLRPSLRPQ